MPEADSWGFPNAATPAGSADYYVVRFSPPAQRHRLARWYAWFAHLDTLVARANDPGVARLKLDWWREECHQMLHDQARHPLAQRLSGQVTAPWQVQQMQQALDAAEARILRRQPADLAELHDQCNAHQASRLRLLCDSQDADLSETLHRLAILIGTVQRLQHLGKDARDGYLSLPTDRLQSLGITLDRLNHDRQVPQLAQLGHDLLQALPIHRYRQLIALREDPRLHPALRSAAQHLRLAQVLGKQGFAARPQPATLTPLGWLWQAWRIR